MAGGAQHKFFFRFRSAVRLNDWQSIQKEHWLFGAVKYIDVSESTLMAEFVAYSWSFPGFMSMKEFFAMRWNAYMLFEKSIEPLRRRIKEIRDAGEQ